MTTGPSGREAEETAMRTSLHQRPRGAPRQDNLSRAAGPNRPPPSRTPAARPSAVGLRPILDRVGRFGRSATIGFDGAARPFRPAVPPKPMV